ncbi:MAG: antitoxin [Gemmatimonadetes bacterium]|nr:antitoxin [Gemmatimonadota bacterium]
MARTTIDIDTPILRDLKRLQKRERKSLGRLVSDLLAGALARRRSDRDTDRKFRWCSQPMNALIDIADKEAVYAALDDSRE